MFGLSTPELLIIMVIVLVVFGAGKLPKVMRDLGKGVRSFKETMNEKDNPVDSVAQAKMVDVEAAPKKEGA